MTIKWLIKWLLEKLSPLIEVESWVTNIFMRLDKLERSSHPPLFPKDEVAKIKKRLSDLEMVTFVEKIKKYKWEGTD